MQRCLNLATETFAICKLFNNDTNKATITEKSMKAISAFNKTSKLSARITLQIQILFLRICGLTED